MIGERVSHPFMTDLRRSESPHDDHGMMGCEMAAKQALVDMYQYTHTDYARQRVFNDLVAAIKSICPKARVIT